MELSDVIVGDVYRTNTAIPYEVGLFQHRLLPPTRVRVVSIDGNGLVQVVALDGAHPALGVPPGNLVADER